MSAFLLLILLVVSFALGLAVSLFIFLNGYAGEMRFKGKDDAELKITRDPRDLVAKHNYIVLKIRK